MNIYIYIYILSTRVYVYTYIYIYVQYSDIFVAACWPKCLDRPLLCVTPLRTLGATSLDRCAAA